MSGPSALVTGASGFLGARLVALLAARGEHVNAMVRPGSPLDGLQGLPWDRVRLVYGDVTVPNSVYAAMAGCDRAYHLATNFTFGERRSQLVLRPTVEGTRSVLEAARARSLRKLVITGSTITLGASAMRETVDEDSQRAIPRDAEAYVFAKATAQRCVIEQVRAGVPAVLVLPSAFVGPGDARPTPTGAGILDYVQRRGRVPIPDGGLNVVDVDDVALGHRLAMDHGTVGESYILGGENITFLEMFAMLSDVAGLPPPWLRLPAPLLGLGARIMERGARRAGRTASVTRRVVRDFVGKYAWVSSAKAERELGYRHRPARIALERSVKWYTENGYFEKRLERAIRAHSP